MMRLAFVLCLVAVASAAPQIRSLLPQLIDDRIVGGKNVFIEDYNYQCSLMYYGSHTCGCFIISSLYAVTSGHCTDGAPASTLTVRAGSSFRNIGGVVVSLTTYYQHPNFDSNNVDYDISILQFLTDITFTNSIGTIALPTLNQEVAAGTPAVVTGWGSTQEGGALSLQLQAVEIPIVSQEDCKAAHGSSAITDRMICAGLKEGGKDACQRDSGGPLVVNDVAVGIVSWGYGCARPEKPGVYSSVPNLRGYIKEVTSL